MVQANWGVGRGQDSDRAMPPNVVASSKGMSRGLATSSQGGRRKCRRLGTTASRPERVTVAWVIGMKAEDGEDQPDWSTG